ncbi:hybrid sensor histidine kinase/response regulator [Leptolyngbya sp. NIES-2104]|uniref:hybrid sensor histidine kinase/response regulator n=1 Tax=Leptolyngbya sp. NIES-2104 TaxID=1552121 RepID=UPI0006ECAC3D|nr:ATP-binding protein [Leptolyngbya sp. NIES-2104]GAP95516.1 signal transduction histidine kinase [Leptolyngbya sp. NIES-2104]
MNGDEFIEQIQDVQRQVEELQQDAQQLPHQQKSRLTESLERLTTALRDLQVAEEAIQLLLSAVQQSRDSIVITNAHLDSPGPEIVYVNPAFTEMTGYAAEEVLGRSPRMLQGKHTERAVLDALRRNIAQGNPFHGEAINYHKDGNEFYVEWNITPIRSTQQKITHYVAIQRNITDRKLLEKERERLLAQEQSARDAAEVANRSKDEFLATLSHELRTPLTPILGWSRVLRTQELPQDKLQQALETIEENAKRQAQLVDDLLDLARIVRGKMTLNFASVSLLEVIVAALETVRLAAEARSIRIETNLDGALSPVMGDAGRLQQVIWNLLSNAIKFTPVEGRITVTLSKHDRSARIQISDTGQGIKSEFLPHVFDRFRQEDSSITRQFGGLGLGLSLCRQLVEAHGGTIKAESAGIGQGATFTVELPLMPDVPSREAPMREMLKPSLQSVRVLIVEDDLSTLQFLSFIIEQQGAIVTPVSSAQAALEQFQRSQFDILISDIGMQDMDGFTLLHHIRAFAEELPAIALTAYATQRNREQALEIGFNEHLAKPIEPEKLIYTIATVLQR